MQKELVLRAAQVESTAVLGAELFEHAKHSMGLPAHVVQSAVHDPVAEHSNEAPTHWVQSFWQVPPHRYGVAGHVEQSCTGLHPLPH
jgi:hypothetical protein